MPQCPLKGTKTFAPGRHKGAALVLRRRRETPADRGCDIERPAGLDRPVGERKREDLVARPVGARDRGVEIERRALFIDHGPAGDAERRNISRTGARSAQRAVPTRASRSARRSARRRENFIVLRCDDQLALA